MIHVGIDLHSRNMTLVAVNDNGELICEVKTKSNSTNLERFLTDLMIPFKLLLNVQAIGIGWRIGAEIRALFYNWLMPKC